MIIPSDITRLYFFKEVSEVRNITTLASLELSTKGEPLWIIELDGVGDNNLKIKKHQNNGGSYIYKVKFDGSLDRPNDVGLLFGWLKII